MAFASLRDGLATTNRQICRGIPKTSRQRRVCSPGTRYSSHRPAGSPDPAHRAFLPDLAPTDKEQRTGGSFPRLESVVSLLWGVAPSLSVTPESLNQLYPLPTQRLISGRRSSSNPASPTGATLLAAPAAAPCAPPRPTAPAAACAPAPSANGGEVLGPASRARSGELRRRRLGSLDRVSETGTGESPGGLGGNPSQTKAARPATASAAAALGPTNPAGARKPPPGPPQRPPPRGLPTQQSWQPSFSWALPWADGEAVPGHRHSHSAVSATLPSALPMDVTPRGGAWIAAEGERPFPRRTSMDAASVAAAWGGAPTTPQTTPSKNPASPPYLQLQSPPGGKPPIAPQRVVISPPPMSLTAAENDGEEEKKSSAGAALWSAANATAAAGEAGGSPAQGEARSRAQQPALRAGMVGSTSERRSSAGWGALGAIASTSADAAAAAAQGSAWWAPAPSGASPCGSPSSAAAAASPTGSESSVRSSLTTSASAPFPAARPVPWRRAVSLDSSAYSGARSASNTGPWAPPPPVSALAAYAASLPRSESGGRVSASGDALPPPFLVRRPSRELGLSPLGRTASEQSAVSSSSAELASPPRHARPAAAAQGSSVSGAASARLGAATASGGAGGSSSFFAESAALSLAATSREVSSTCASPTGAASTAVVSVAAVAAAAKVAACAHRGGSITGGGVGEDGDDKTGNDRRPPSFSAVEMPADAAEGRVSGDDGGAVSPRNRRGAASDAEEEEDAEDSDSTERVPSPDLPLPAPLRAASGSLTAADTGSPKPASPGLPASPKKAQSQNGRLVSKKYGTRMMKQHDAAWAAGGALQAARVAGGLAVVGLALLLRGRLASMLFVAEGTVA